MFLAIMRYLEGQGRDHESATTGAYAATKALMARFGACPQDERTWQAGQPHHASNAHDKNAICNSRSTCRRGPLFVFPIHTIGFSEHVTCPYITI
ncbi:MAG: hypothetical protein ACOZHQ_18210 [Thermodesulfobacteriota bacterium]